jgi:phthalate 4,5-cis-dihydrodiol dehydrogenase
MAFLTFADGGCASLVYSGYDRFDSDEFSNWVGELGQPKVAPQHGSTRRALETLGGGDESAVRAQRYGYGGGLQYAAPDGKRWHQPHFGTIVVSCEKADLRPSVDGILVYGREGAEEVSVPPSSGVPGRAEVLDELWQAIRKNTKPTHSGTFARGTLEVCLAIMESARKGSEVFLAK